MKAVLSSLTFFSLVLPTLSASYNLLQEYSGPNWFQNWDFYGDSGDFNGSAPWDNTTVGAHARSSAGLIFRRLMLGAFRLLLGDVFYMGRVNGSSLAYVDSNSGHAIIKVDNTSFVPYNEKRDSVSVHHTRL